MSETKAVVADTRPIVMELEAGEYHWCACGRSQAQPYCDGSHAGCGIEPMAFSLPEKKKVALCTCKATNNAPFCDGAHKHLGKD